MRFRRSIVCTEGCCTKPSPRRSPPAQRQPAQLTPAECQRSDARAQLPQKSHCPRPLTALPLQYASSPCRGLRNKFRLPCGASADRALRWAEHIARRSSREREEIPSKRVWPESALRAVDQAQRPRSPECPLEENLCV